MLMGIAPLLTGEMLAALDRLGHGDVLVVADGNFPAHHFGVPVVSTTTPSTPEVVRAIRTVLPLDGHEGPAVHLMDPVGVAAPVQAELRSAVAVPDDRIASLGRFAFYDLAATADLIVRTTETRVYANLAIRKGVVGDGAPA